MTREVIEFDVVIVGAGPSGLTSACRLMQLAQQASAELSVCVVEKGSEVGAHILSGAVIEPKALEELFPDWKVRNAPLTCAVKEDQVYMLHNATSATKLPSYIIPKPMHNSGNYIASLGNLCRWLAIQAEQLGVEIFPGFAASEVLFHTDGSVKGIATGDMGIDRDGNHKDTYMQGMEIHAKYTLFSEGCHGHLGKQLIEKFALNASSEPQHYGLGIKELWDIDPSRHQEGLVIHGTGWPLTQSNTSGGFFLYHAENNQIAVGLIVDLNYQNPWLSPYDEFQRLKHHPLVAQYLEGGKRVSYGARAITKGGYHSLPDMHMPGALLLGCDAGTLNFSKIKGTHTAMKSGMIAAESVFEAIQNKQPSGSDLKSYKEKLEASWLYEELYRSRNFGAAVHKFGTWLGGAFNFFEQNLFNGKMPLAIKDMNRDHDQLQLASNSTALQYPRYDDKLSFDKMSSVFISNTSHEEDQPCHLILKDKSTPIKVNLTKWQEPAQRYCPAGVYEVIDLENEHALQINAQNCLHCKTCDIKDPSQNINWTPPEGGGGPNYPNM